MSTTTNFKRIALVAVAALGLSIVSVVPSNANIVGALTVTTTNGAIEVNSAGYARSDSTTAATVSIKGFANAGTTDSILVRFTAGSAPTGAATFDTRNILLVALDTALATGVATTLKGKPSSAGGQGITAGTNGSAWDIPLGQESGTVGNGNVGILTNAGIGNLGGKFAVFLDSAMAKTVGTYTIDYSIQAFQASGELTTAATAGTLSIVVTTAGTTSAVTAGSSGTSTAVMYGGSTFPSGTVVDSTTVTAANTPSTSTAAAVIRVTQKTAAGLVARESITVTSTIGNVGLCGGTLGKLQVIWVVNGN